MREIQVSEITKTVRQMCMDAAYHLPKDIYEGLKKGRETEESSVGRIVLDQMCIRDRWYGLWGLKLKAYLILSILYDLIRLC